MKASAAIFLAVLTISAAWQDPDGDYSEEDYSWNPPQTTVRPVRPTTGRPQSSSSRPQSSSNGRPQSSSSSGRPQSSSNGRPQESSDDWCYPVADRIYSQLMRQENGNPMEVLSTLEGWFSVRAAPNSSPSERLTVLVQTANSRLASSSYRPVIAAVADKLAEQLASGGAVRVNLRPATGSTGFTATVVFGGQQQTTSSNNNNNNNRPSNPATNWWSEGGSQGSGTQRGTQRPVGYRRPMSRGLEEAPEQVLTEQSVTQEPGSQAA